MNLSRELAQQIADHIDEVRKYLGRLSEDERQEILQSIESHIHDVLEERSTGEPSTSLLEAVIAEMDPPASYGELSIAPSKKRPVFVTTTLLLGITAAALVIAAIKQSPAETTEPTGHWSSVDFVESIEQFDPAVKKWNGDLHLKELTFLANGKTDKSFWTWENDTLHHSKDNTDANFLIKEISGENYLFFEWISGDVTHRGFPPKYYVLKKRKTESAQTEIHR